MLVHLHLHAESTRKSIKECRSGFYFTVTHAINKATKKCCGNAGFANFSLHRNAFSSCFFNELQKPTLGILIQYFEATGGISKPGSIGKKYSKYEYVDRYSIGDTQIRPSICDKSFCGSQQKDEDQVGCSRVLAPFVAEPRSRNLYFPF